MANEAYTDGSITLTEGSTAVSGTGTAWEVFGVGGGLLTADGLNEAIPISAVPSDGALTLQWRSPVSLTTSNYAIIPFTAEQMRALWANRQLSQMIARAVGVNLARSAFGSVIGDRDAYDAEDAGFAFVLVEESEDPVLYLKLSDADADWSSAKPWRGPAGEGGTPGTGDAYDIIVDDPGKPGSGEVLLLHKFANAVSFATDMAGSQVVVGANPAASAEYSLTKNGVEFATLTIATNGTPTFAGETSFGAGDVLRVIAPNPRDETLSGVSMTLAGNRA